MVTFQRNGRFVCPTLHQEYEKALWLGVFVVKMSPVRRPIRLHPFTQKHGLRVLYHLLGQPRQPASGLLWRIGVLGAPTFEHLPEVGIKQVLARRRQREERVEIASPGQLPSTSSLMYCTSTSISHEISVVNGWNRINGCRLPIRSVLLYTIIHSQIWKSSHQDKKNFFLW